MTETIRLRIIRHSYIFQVGLVLDASGYIQEYGKVKGYAVPDVGDGSAGLLPLDCVEKVSGYPEETGPYCGKCLLTKVSNFYKDPNQTGVSPIGMVAPEKVRVIHYPDCQQLVFYMPQYAYDAAGYQLINNLTGEILEDLAVKDRLNGGTMILVDTLPYPPGFYTIEAGWPDGWTHQVRFIKFAEGYPNSRYENPPNAVLRAIKNQECHLQPPAEEITEKPTHSSIKKQTPYPGYEHPAGNVTMIQSGNEHRIFDSNSVEIENGVDLNKFKKELIGKFGPVVSYSQEGRGGTITYQDGPVTIHFDWEFAGGNAVVLFYIPEEKYWEAHTKTPLSRRDEILAFVANQVIRDQAPGCHFEVYSNSISIVR